MSEKTTWLWSDNQLFERILYIFICTVLKVESPIFTVKVRDEVYFFNQNYIFIFFSKNNLNYEEYLKKDLDV